MKGQLDKQQEQARLAAAISRESLDKFEENLLSSEDDNEERITFWTRAQLEKRTHELNLAKENGTIQPFHPNFSGKRLSGVEELGMSDVEDIISASRSTTSDSQVRQSKITVRSSPVANATDKLSVCRSCHKTCKKKLSGPNSPTLVSNSLKVQHSQSSPNRCCQLNGSITRSSVSSVSSTVTGDQSQSELSSQTNTSNNNTLSNEQEQEKEKLISETSSTSVPTPIPVSIASAVASATIASLLNGNYFSSDNKNVNERKKPTPKSLLRQTDNSSEIKAGGRQSLRKQSNKDHFVPCNCKCNPEDFYNTTLSPDEMHQETCKILPSIIDKKTSPIKLDENNPHKNCKCVCKSKNKKYDDEQLDDDLSLVLIGLAQLNPAAQLLNSESFVPTISVVPPTPDSILSKTSTNIWDNHSTSMISGTAKKTTSQIPGQAVIENIPEDSADESLDEEPPYRPMNVGLKRFGTLSSLERLPSDEMVEDGSEDGDVTKVERDRTRVGNENVEEDDDIEVITRQVFVEKSDVDIQDEQANWTSRAGSFVAGKMSFFEESRAFIDKYLGRWNQEEQSGLNDEEQLDECTSGANSGEEIWGTPTSGGENDEMHMMNSDCTQSSPTKSSTSLIDDDDDTELMMDELLMAPPMTASSIRGLLPRRTLEPLFEEETESDEEKTQQDCEEFKKGETASNGHDLEDSTGSSSDGMEEEPDHLNRYQRQLTILSMAKCSSSMPNVVTTNQALYGSSAMMTKTITTMKLVPIMATNSSNSSIINSANVSTSTTVSSTKMQPEPQSESGKTLITSTIRKAKFSPPPPPPRRLLLTQTKQRSVQQQTNGTPHQPLEINQKSGDIADIGSLVAAVKKATIKCQQANQKVVSTMKSCAENIVPIENRQSITVKQSSMPQPQSVVNQIKTNQTLISSTTDSITTTATGTLTMTTTKQIPSTSATSTSNQKKLASVQHGSGLSPRLEMRLALNHDIMGDEDLICYDPGPNLTTILGHDLSTFHRLTGRDLLTRSATNRVQPRETVISFSQQRNSKMDTPTVNRKRPNQNQEPNRQQLQHLHPDRNTWSSSAFVDQIENNDVNVDRSKNNNSIKDESCLSDLEVLAKREKIFCMSQLRSGSPARSLMMATSISSMALTETEIDTAIPKRTRKIGRDETALMTAGKGNRLVNFLTRRNSENQLANNCSQHSLTESNCSSSTERRPVSPKKDNDKPSLNRRFWKQITKRRRANSISEIEAS